MPRPTLRGIISLCRGFDLAHAKTCTKPNEMAPHALYRTRQGDGDGLRPSPPPPAIFMAEVYHFPRSGREGAARGRLLPPQTPPPSSLFSWDRRSSWGRDWSTWPILKRAKSAFTNASKVQRPLPPQTPPTPPSTGLEANPA